MYFAETLIDVGMWSVYYKDHMSELRIENIAEVMGSNPVGALDCFLGFICNCLSYITTAKISYTSMMWVC